MSNAHRLVPGAIEFRAVSEAKKAHTEPESRSVDCVVRVERSA